MINPLQAAVQTVGRTIGAAGGALGYQPARDLGGQLTGGQRTYNIVPAPAYSPAPAPISAPIPSISGSVQGASTYNPASTSNPIQSPSGGGGNGNPGSNFNPGPGTNIPNPGQPQVDYNAIYQPALDALNGALASANQGYAAQEAGINSQSQQAQGQLNTDLQGQLGQISQAKTTQTTQSNNAMAQARQAYNEISQGIQSRYGGTTGTGAFANELAGRTTSNNLAQFQNNLTNALGGLDQAAQHVQLVHDQNIKDLTAQTEAAIQQARSALQTNIANIGMQQGQVQSAKAQQIANAVIDYQKTVQQVQAMNAQYQQQLQLQQNQIQAQLAYARQLGSGYLNSAVQQNAQQQNPAQLTASSLYGGNPQAQTSQGVGGQGQIQFPQSLTQSNIAPIQGLGQGNLVIGPDGRPVVQ